MDKVIVYQFTLYDISTDQRRRSRRWATREAIERLAGEILEDTACELDASTLISDISGMSTIGFNPKPRTGFQRQVTS